MPSKPLLDEKEMSQAIEKMAHEIREEFPSLNNVVLVGITRRGVPLAQRISKILSDSSNRNNQRQRRVEGEAPTALPVEGATRAPVIEIPVGVLDITLYRDDLSRLDYHPQVRRTEIPFSIDDKDVFLIDDVLFAGRTIRCALDALFDLGRPHVIRLAVLVDREGRELPIQADVVGVHAKAGEGEEVKVSMNEIDGNDAVVVEKITVSNA